MRRRPFNTLPIKICSNKEAGWNIIEQTENKRRPCLQAEDDKEFRGIRNIVRTRTAVKGLHKTFRIFPNSDPASVASGYL